MKGVSQPSSFKLHIEVGVIVAIEIKLSSLDGLFLGGVPKLLLAFERAAGICNPSSTAPGYLLVQSSTF